MSTTVAARRYPMGPRPGPRPDPGLRRLGPALSGRRLPMTAIFYSALGHVLFFGGITAFVMWSGWRPEKVQVVNLVPMVAAVGVPNAPVAPVGPRPKAPVAARPPEPEPQPEAPHPASVDPHREKHGLD